MEQSIFKALVDQYQTPHPLLGVDGQAFPMIPYSMKLDLIQNAEPFQGLAMDDFVNAETRRVKQLLDAANEKGDAQLATRVLNELYPLMVEDILSGNPIAVQVYSPVVNQMRYIIGVTQQPQAQPVVKEPVAQAEVAEPKPSTAKDEVPVVAGAVEAKPEAPVAAAAETEAPIAEDVETVVAEPAQEPRQPKQMQPDVQESKPVSQEGRPAQTEPKGAPAATRRKKRTPASAIVLFILGAAFILAFLLINAFPLIGIGTYEELYMMGLLDIASGCLVLAVVCCVIATIILWRSKKA